MATEHVLKADAVTEIGSSRIGCGNIWEREYTLPAGETKEGLTAILDLLDEGGERMVVGEGSIVDLGGRLWRVAEITEDGGRQGPPGTVRLRAAQERLFAGVDFGPESDVEDLVLRQLQHFDHGGRDDRTPVAWLERAHETLSDQGHDRTADRLGRAVAAAFGRADARVDALVFRFFQDRPGAAGGDALARALVADPDRLVDDPNPVPGSAASTTERAGLLAVLAWFDLRDRQPPDDLLSRAKQAVLAGRGAPLLYRLWRIDGDWMEQHLDAVLSTYPDKAYAGFLGLQQRGRSPTQALDAVLPHADPKGKRYLSRSIRMSADLDQAVKKALLGRIQSA